MAYVHLLNEVYKGASRDNLSSCRYLYGALLPSSQLSQAKTLCDFYYLLKESPKHSSTALSLNAYILEHTCSQEKAAVLRKFAEDERKYETDQEIPKLRLRELLARVASELDESQADSLVKSMARLELRMNPDHFMNSRNSCVEMTLEVFTQMEQQEFLKPGVASLSVLEDYLKEIGRNDLVSQHLKDYNPKQPFTLAVMHVPVGQELATPDPLSHYQCMLVDAYNTMPEIPHNQWPPIQKAEYVSLALITSEDMRRDDFFSRNTVRGSVDDIMKHKELIEFDKVFPKEVKELSHAILFEGRPGCGKTTLMFKVSKDWAKGKVLKGVKLLILVTLRRFMGKPNITLEDLLGVYCPSSSIVKELVNIISLSRGKGVYFVFDGLDEYRPAKEEGNLISDIIRGIKLPNATVIMTSRPVEAHRFRKLSRRNVEIEIIGFLENQIAYYIRDHYEHNPGKAASLIEYLKSHPNISRMCYLPLHLAMVVYLYEKLPNLPETETGMYKKFLVHTLLRSLERENPSECDDFELHDIDDLPWQKISIFKKICRLAFEATRSQKQIFTGKEIVDEKILPVPPSGREIDSLGLLTVDRQVAETSFPTRMYSFLHLTLQEFLSALYLTRQLSDQEQAAVIKAHGGDVHMRVVWKFFCGLAHESPTFLNSFTAIARQNTSNRLAVLHMMHCAYESTKPESCSSLVALLHGKIDVKDVSLNPSDCSILGYVSTKAYAQVTELDLSYCHIGPEGIEAFVQQLQQLPEPLSNVVTLRLRARIDFRPVGTKGASALATLLKKLPNLGELRLYGNELQTEKFRLLVPIVTGMTNIHTLILSRNSLDETAGPLISDILGQLPELHTFYVSYNPIGSKGLADMMPGLLRSQNLEILGLRGNSLSAEAGKCLQEVLKSLPRIKSLILYQNRLQDIGVQDMLPGLWEAPMLEELSLVENQISDCGAIALSGYLRTTATLKEVRLYYNSNIADQGKTELRKAVLGRPAHLGELKLAL